MAHAYTVATVGVSLDFLDGRSLFPGTGACDRLGGFLFVCWFLCVFGWLFCFTSLYTDGSRRLQMSRLEWTGMVYGVIRLCFLSFRSPPVSFHTMGASRFFLQLMLDEY